MSGEEPATHEPSVPERMTAVLLTRHGGPEALEVRDDVPVPRPGDDQVLVRVAAAGMNNTDVWSREGAYGTADDPDAVGGWRGTPLEFPRIQGGDIAGTIVATGRAVDPGRRGQRVLVDPALYDGDGDDIELDVRRLYLHSRSIIGSAMWTPAHYGRLVEEARHGSFRPVVAQTFPLARIGEAQQEFARKGFVGKLVLSLGD